jgi:hypothetical protein
MYARAIMFLAGGESRIFVGRDHSDGDRNDIRAAEFCACWVSSDPRSFLRMARTDAGRILRTRRHQVELLANALLEFGSLDAEQIKAAMSGVPDALRRRQWNSSAVNAASFVNSFGMLSVR